MHVAAHRPAPQLVGRAAGDQGAGQVEVGRPQHHRGVVRQPRGTPTSSVVADQRDRRQVATPPGEPAGEPLADRAQPSVSCPPGTPSAPRRSCSWMSTSLSGRTVFARIQARSGSATACHSATSAATSRSRRACTCRARPRRVVVVRLVTGDHVGAQPDHVREQVTHRPVRAGGHPQLRPLRRQVRTPGRSPAAELGSTPRRRPRAHPTTPGAPAPRSGAGVGTPRRLRALRGRFSAARLLQRVRVNESCAEWSSAGRVRVEGVRADRRRRPRAVGLRAGQGSGLHPRGACAERVDGLVRAGARRA